MSRPAHRTAHREPRFLFRIGNDDRAAAAQDEFEQVIVQRHAFGRQHRAALDSEDEFSRVVFFVEERNEERVARHQFGRAAIDRFVDAGKAERRAFPAAGRTRGNGCVAGLPAQTRDRARQFRGERFQRGESARLVRVRRRAAQLHHAEHSIVRLERYGNRRALAGGFVRAEIRLGDGKRLAGRAGAAGEIALDPPRWETRNSQLRTSGGGSCPADRFVGLGLGEEERGVAPVGLAKMVDR